MAQQTLVLTFLQILFTIVATTLPLHSSAKSAREIFTPENLAFCSPERTNIWERSDDPSLNFNVISNYTKRTHVGFVSFLSAKNKFVWVQAIAIDDPDKDENSLVFIFKKAPYDLVKQHVETENIDPFSLTVECNINSHNERYPRLKEILQMAGWKHGAEYVQFTKQIDIPKIPAPVTPPMLNIPEFRISLGSRRKRHILAENRQILNLYQTADIQPWLNCTSEYLNRYVEQNTPRFLAWSHSTVIGALALKMAASRTAIIDLLAVHPRYQKHGVATDLINHAEAYIASRGGNQVKINCLADNLAAMGCYRQAGYPCTGGKQHWCAAVTKYPTPQQRALSSPPAAEAATAFCLHCGKEVCK